MKSKDLAVDSKAPATIATAQSFGIEALNLPDGCVTGGKTTCSLIVTKPPKVVTSGHEGPKWYTLKKEFDGKPPIWQELQADKVVLPRGSVVPTK
jgi:hypothetical protein